MFVKLSHNAWSSVSQRVPELHAGMMRKHRVKAGRKAHVYELPPVAWRQVLDVLQADAFGARGGRKELPVSFYTALRDIQAAVSSHEHHPALSGHAAMGVSSQRFLLWELDGVDLLAYPSRIHDVNVVASRAIHPVLMLPHVVVVNGHTVTEWYETDACEMAMEYSLNPNNHWAFV